MQGTDAESIRDRLMVSPIRFDEASHTYTLGDREYKGVTSTLIPFAYPHAYDTPENMTEEQWHEILSKAAGKGTAVHRDIQRYCEGGDFPQTPEGLSWMEAESQHKIEWIANEYLVTSGEFASKADIVALVDGALSIIDIKRTSELHYDTVTLQCSLYRKWFEQMNRGMKVERIFVFWCREDKWKLAELSPIATHDLNALIKAYREQDETFVFNPMPRWCTRKMLKELSMLLDVKKEAEAKIARIQAEMEVNMERYGAAPMDTEQGLHITYVQPSVAKTFDKARFEKENPGVLEGYMKESRKKGFIKITQKKKEE